MMRLFAILACLLCLTACGQVPQPFLQQRHAIAGNPFLDTPTAVGIAVLPVAHVPSPLGAQISAAVAERFQALEIPAEAVDSNRGLGFTLRGDAESIETSGSQVRLRIVWRLISRGGALTADYAQAASIATTAWENGGPEAAAVVALEAARQIAIIIGGEAPTPTIVEAPRPRFPSVSVKPVDGAPGDGREALRLAVLQLLTQNRVPRDDVTPTITLTCVVTTEAINAKLQRVEIVWRAVTRDGAELGTVKLENTIPAGALEGSWGPVAFAIADAALNDLLQLLVATPHPAVPD